MIEYIKTFFIVLIIFIIWSFLIDVIDKYIFPIKRHSKNKKRWEERETERFDSVFTIGEKMIVSKEAFIQALYVRGYKDYKEECINKHLVFFSSCDDKKEKTLFALQLKNQPLMLSDFEDMKLVELRLNCQKTIAIVNNIELTDDMNEYISIVKFEIWDKNWIEQQENDEETKLDNYINKFRNMK